MGIKIEIERLVVSISIHFIRVTISGSPISFYYVRCAGSVQDAAAEKWPLSAVRSTSRRPRVKT